MTSGGGRFWSRSGVVTTASYNAANRNPAWEYDAAGNVLSRNEPADPNMWEPYAPARYSFDAAGREASVTQTRSYRMVRNNQLVIETNVFTNTNTYDGDNQVVRYTPARATTLNGTTTTTGPTTYYLRSSVLGRMACQIN